MDATTVQRLLAEDPIARELLSARMPARFAYVGLDGAPRVVPMTFSYRDGAIVFCTPPSTAKVRALRANPRVAITIDTDSPPYHVLQLRGEAEVEDVPGVPPEVEETASRYNGAEFGKAWAEQIGRMFQSTAVIRVRPDWAELLDFERRFPAEISRAMAAAGAP
jgi:PPOX class probable F420-dependent enzyme